MNPNIKERMPVVSSCGCNIGTVDHVEGEKIKLTKEGGEHHFIPADWVAGVDDKVHLNKNADEARRDWKSEVAGSW